MTEEIKVNKFGGKQHSVAHRCQALFPRAILEVARLRCEGFEQHGYEDDNYLKIPIDENVGRALRHILLFMAGDREDGNPREHLIHACCRIMMAVEESMIEDERNNSELEQLRLEYGYPKD